MECILALLVLKLFWISLVFFPVLGNQLAKNAAIENSEVNQLLKIFNGCHIKFFVTEDTTESRLSSYINASTYITSETTFTIKLIILLYSDSNSNSRQYATCYYISCLHCSRHSHCFVHVYMEDEFSISGKNYLILENIMEKLANQGEWPHHTIFMGNFQNYSEVQQQNRLKFYRDILPETIAHGLIFAMDVTNISTKVQFLCIPCQTTFASVDLGNIKKENHSIFYAMSLNGNSRGVYTTVSEEALFDIEHSCDIGARKVQPAYFRAPAAVCVLRTLQSKYNFSFYTAKNFAKKYKGEAEFYHVVHALITNKNYKAKIQTRTIDWIPYGVKYESYQFIAFQAKPTISVEIFLMPFDILSWIILFSCIVGVAATSWLGICSTPRKPNIFKIISQLILILLEQSVPLENTLLTSESARAVIISLRICLGIFILMMVVIGTGYKGVIFSLLAQGLPPSWPENIHELTDDARFTLFSNDRIEYGEQGSDNMKQVPLLQDFFGLVDMTGVAGKDYPMEYSILNRTQASIYTFYMTNENMISDLILKTQMWHREIRKDDEYQIGNRSSKKFALLSMNPDVFAAVLTKLKPRLVASKAVIISGFRAIIPWLTYRNFLFDMFSDSLARLEQNGFLMAFHREKEIWATCSALRKTETIMKAKYNMSGEEYSTQIDTNRCVNKALAELMVGRRIDEDSFVSALSSKQMWGLFAILLGALATTCLVAICEIIAFRIIP